MQHSLAGCSGEYRAVADGGGQSVNQSLDIASEQGERRNDGPTDQSARHGVLDRRSASIVS
jgi:hypothetical protein